MSASPFLTIPLVSVHRLGWIGLGESRVFTMDALGGFGTLRELIAQEIGPEAEADMVQRAGFASGQRLAAAGRGSGDLTPDEDGFRQALGLLSVGGYGNLRSAEVRFDDQWARVVVAHSLEGWAFRQTGTRTSPSCDFLRGMFAGIMDGLSNGSGADGEVDLSIAPGAFGADTPGQEAGSGLDIACVETACIAAGEEACHFVVGPAHLLQAEGLAPAPIAQSSVRETLLRLNRQLEAILDSSRKDPLTKLYNRSYFEAALRQRIGYAKRRSDVVSLGVIDIDSFKSINDTHGHMSGDRVLRQIARSLEQQARENDVVARIGGDELVWLMPATPGEAALSVAQRLRRTVADLAPAIGLDVTVSIGVANFPHDASTPAELFERADTALYAAKRAGGDQAVSFATSSAAAPTNGSGSKPAAAAAPPAAKTEPSVQARGIARTRAADEHAAVKPRAAEAPPAQPPPARPTATGKLRPHTRNGRVEAPREPEIDPATAEAFPRPRALRGRKARY